MGIYQRNKLRCFSGKLYKAVKHQQRCRNNSYKLCQKFLKQHAKELIDKKDNDKSKIVKRIKIVESRRAMYK
eukprot:11375789-Ditylum_brightwellii.AAC.1